MNRLLFPISNGGITKCPPHLLWLFNVPDELIPSTKSAQVNHFSCHVLSVKKMQPVTGLGGNVCTYKQAILETAKRPSSEDPNEHAA